MTILIAWTAASVVATIPMARVLATGSATAHDLVPVHPASERPAA